MRRVGIAPRPDLLDRLRLIVQVLKLLISLINIIIGHGLSSLSACTNYPRPVVLSFYYMICDLPVYLVSAFTSHVDNEL